MSRTSPLEKAGLFFKDLKVFKDFKEAILFCGIRRR